MNQRKCALELISDSSLSGSKTIATPVELNQKFTTCEFNNHIGGPPDPVLADPGKYQRLVGRLLYLTITRPDIAFVVQSLSQFMHAPKQSHWDAALRVVNYIKQAPGLGVLLFSFSSASLQGFCDADWGLV
ncbi:uncharacterized mitochondrial protein AtMg00810-like [Solanum tuberosum]|uniref:uncharacterized mitochondrial protein AtMg00810-like n=1 Tax=Solanum tuberosum TaxID=4113 RepID=UPI00073A09EA|nr:PREDICTED: uncharacterized mitochondrial protein AtMg00810-like [Solanum tuberosum]